MHAHTICQWQCPVSAPSDERWSLPHGEEAGRCCRIPSPARKSWVWGAISSLDAVVISESPAAWLRFRASTTWASKIWSAGTQHQRPPTDISDAAARHIYFHQLANSCKALAHRSAVSNDKLAWNHSCDECPTACPHGNMWTQYMCPPCSEQLVADVLQLFEHLARRPVQLLRDAALLLWRQLHRKQNRRLISMLCCCSFWDESHHKVLHWDFPHHACSRVCRLDRCAFSRARRQGQLGPPAPGRTARTGRRRRRP